jgi:hypothetical protein
MEKISVTHDPDQDVYEVAFPEDETAVVLTIKELEQLKEAVDCAIAELTA